MLYTEAFQEKGPVVAAPGTVEFGDITFYGELKDRLLMNFNRLQDKEHWSPEKIFKGPEYDWPGDIEGRTILAISMLSRCLAIESSNLDIIMSLLEERLNGNGYFGTVHEDGIFDEQQLSSHGWYGRGLIEYYKWKSDEKTRDRIIKLLQGYILTTYKQWRSYPINARVIDKEGGFIGEKSDVRTGNWILSTDVSCAFIFGGAVMDMYVLTSDRRLLEIAVDMASVFMEVDHENRNSQLHATLTTLRWILKLYEYTGEWKYLNYVEKIHDCISNKALTANFETYNWFNIPKWTEGCAVVDLFQLSLNLWRITGKCCYADFAELIYYNGITRLQRLNGGMGLDTCPKDGEYGLKTADYEAWWCCSMRCAEAFTNAVMFSYAAEGDTVWVPMFFNNRALLRLQSGIIEVVQESEYPGNGSVRLEILECICQDEVSIRFRLPMWVEGFRLKVNGEKTGAAVLEGFVEVRGRWMKGDVISYHMDYSPRIEYLHKELDLNPEIIGPKAFSVFYGPLQLAADTYRTSYREEMKILVKKELLSEHVLFRPDDQAEHESRFDIPEAHFYVQVSGKKEEVLLTPICESTRYTRRILEDNTQFVLFDGIEV